MEANSVIAEAAWVSYSVESRLERTSSGVSNSNRTVKRGLEREW